MGRQKQTDPWGSMASQASSRSERTRLSTKQKVMWSKEWQSRLSSLRHSHLCTIEVHTSLGISGIRKESILVIFLKPLWMSKVIPKQTTVSLQRQAAKIRQKNKQGIWPACWPENSKLYRVLDISKDVLCYSHKDLHTATTWSCQRRCNRTPCW